MDDTLVVEPQNIFTDLGDETYEQELLNNVFQIEVKLNTANLTTLFRTLIEKVNLHYSLLKSIQRSYVSQNDFKSLLDKHKSELESKYGAEFEARDIKLDNIKYETIDLAKKIARDECSIQEKKFEEQNQRRLELSRKQFLDFESQIAKIQQKYDNKIMRVTDIMDQQRATMKQSDRNLETERVRIDLLMSKISKMEELSSYGAAIINSTKTLIPPNSDSQKNENTKLNNTGSEMISVKTRPRKNSNKEPAQHKAGRKNTENEALDHKPANKSKTKRKSSIKSETSSGKKIHITEKPDTEKPVALDTDTESEGELEESGDDGAASFSEDEEDELNSDEIAQKIKERQKTPRTIASLVEATDQIDKLQTEVNSLRDSLSHLRHHIKEKLNQANIVEGVSRKVGPVVEALKKDLEEKLSYKANKKDIAFLLDQKADQDGIGKLKNQFEGIAGLLSRIEAEVNNQSLNYDNLAMALKLLSKGELTEQEIDNVIFNKYYTRNDELDEHLNRLHMAGFPNNRRSRSPDDHKLLPRVVTPSFMDDENNVSNKHLLRRGFSGVIRPKTAQSPTPGPVTSVSVTNSPARPMNVVGIDGNIYRGNVLYHDSTRSVENVETRVKERKRPQSQQQDYVVTGRLTPLDDYTTDLPISRLKSGPRSSSPTRYAQFEPDTHID